MRFIFEALGTPLPKKFNAPVLKPMAPFFIAGVVVFYGVVKLQDAMMASDEWKNDPRNWKYKNKH